MLTINFLNLDAERLKTLDFTTFEQVFKLMLKNRYKLFDDEHFRGDKPYMERVYEIIEAHSPYFWLFLDVKTGEVLGFCYFYDIVPFKNRIHSAFASICFKKEAFGMSAFIGAKRLLNHMFRVMKVFKIKAECFEGNLLIPNFLKKLGFVQMAFKGAEVQMGTMWPGHIGLPRHRSPQHQALHFSQHTAFYGEPEKYTL